MKKTFNKECKECGKKFKAANVRKMFCSGMCKQKKSLTKPHRIVSEMLTDLNIEHDIEYGI